MLVLTILLLLPALSYGFLKPSDHTCKATDNSESHTCSVIHGGDIFLQVIINASGLRLHFKKELSSGFKEVLTIKNGILMIREDAFRNRTEAFINNGTIKIKNVQWEDAGKYNVGIFHTNGTNLKTVEVTLEVKVNPWPVVVFASSGLAGFLLIVLISVCIYRKVKAHKEPGAVI